MELRQAIIDPGKLVESEKALLDGWAKRYDNFIKDGCVDSEKYNKSDIRLLFVLKEVNGGKDWDLRDEIKNEGIRSQTWDVVARWVQEIFDYHKNKKEYTWRELSAQYYSESSAELRKRYLSQVCVMNVKKTPGTETADKGKLDEAAEADRDLLKEQIALYQADIIILCGTENQYRAITDNNKDWQMTTKGIEYYVDENGAVVISYPHPGARIKRCLLHYGLIDAIKEILAN